MPMEGVLPPNVEFKATVNFFCKKSVTFSKVPIFRCTFSYPEYSMVIDSFVVIASAKVHLPKYEIFPTNEMHFGCQLIGTEKCQEIVIKNTGIFDFQFTLKSLSRILAEKNKAKKKGGSKGSSKKSSKKSSEKSSKKSDAKSSKKSKASSKASTGSKKKKGSTK